MFPQTLYNVVLCAVDDDMVMNLLPVVTRIAFCRCHVITVQVL